MHHDICHQHTIMIGTAEVTVDLDCRAIIGLDFEDERGWSASAYEVQDDKGKWHPVKDAKLIKALGEHVDFDVDDIEHDLLNSLDDDEYRAFKQFRDAA